MESKTTFFNSTPESDTTVVIPKCRWYTFVSLGGDVTVITKGMAVAGEEDPDADPSDTDVIAAHGAVWPQNLPFGTQQVQTSRADVDGVWIRVPAGGQVVGAYCENTSVIQ